MNGHQPQSLQTRIGATPGKLALVAVLGVILAYVVGSQLPSRRAPPVELATPAPPALPTTTGDATPTRFGPADAPSPTAGSWPSTNLDVVVRYDPFAIPSWARTAAQVSASLVPSGQTPSVAAREEALAKLQDLGAAVIVEVDGKPLALLGERRVRVGDRVEGYRIKRIDASGIVLAIEGQSP